MNKNEEIAIERINYARNNRLTFLDLSGLRLSNIPENISDMTYLLDIDLSYNQFIYFPEEIAKLDNLQFLNISYNSLQNVYFELGI